MIGDIRCQYGHIRVVTSMGGDTEIMPHVGWFWRIVLFFRSQFGKAIRITDVRQFCQKHRRGE